MKLGLGIYARMLTRENLRFARQMGAESIVIHMADYAADAPRHSHFDADAQGRDVSHARGRLWTLDELRGLRAMVEAEGLELAALENLNPALWHDVLLGGPKAERQLADVCEIIRRIGRAGIPCLGYSFSLAGVWGRTEGEFARGGARTMAMSGDEATRARLAEPLPRGWVANRIYDPEAAPGSGDPVSREELAARHDAFLRAALPVAEEHGVRLALHPDDPPLPVVRGTPRLFHRTDQLRAMLQRHPSPANAIELCLGTLCEMEGVDVCAAVDEFSRDDAIGYIHFRNVKGKAPEYREVFVDEGDIDMLAVLRILAHNDYRGVLIPDHTPFPRCDAPWHAGMAYALGYMRGARAALESAA